MANDDFSADKPITEDDQDQFKRLEFAKRLAATISNKDLKEGYVIGLYSIWGYGKTSTLNLIENELGKAENIEIAKYNPWIFTDQASMIKGLFDLIANALDEKLYTKGEKVGKFLQTYGSLVSPLTLSAFDQSGSAGSIAQGAGNLLNNATLDELKERVTTFFNSSDKRLVIIIDDVDRLDRDELFQLFKLIKIAVDFDRITYLIAFDDIVVGKVLQDRFPGEDNAGQNYIEKIIQVPLHLPSIDQSSLDRYVLSGIEKILEEYKIEMSYDDASSFRDIYDRLLSKRFETPRGANRYLNSLKFILPLVGSDINYADLLVIEAIRITYPSKYHLLRRSKRPLTGHVYEFGLEDKDIAENISKQVSEQFSEGNLVELLKELFPAIDNAFNPHRNQSVTQAPLKVAKRVASVDYFDRYFTYGIPADDVSDTSVLQVIDKQNADDIFEGLNELVSETNEESVIDKIKQYAKDAKDSTELAIALTNFVNNISNNKSSGWSRSPLEETVEIITDMCKSLPDGRVDYIRTVIGKMNNIDQFTMFVRDILLYSKEDAPEKLLDSAELETIKAVIVDKIVTFTNDEPPLHERPLSYVSHLYKFWSDLSGPEQSSDYLKKSLSDADKILDFITLYTSTWYGGGPPHRGDLDSAAYEYMVSVIDAQYLYDKLKTQYSIGDADNYPSFENGIAVVGNESSKEFRDTLAKQFMYIFEKKVSSEEV